MTVFTKEVFSSIKNVGAIAPSSKYLAKRVLKDIKFKNKQVILEFGAGNGALTKHILKRMPSSSKLISLEINEPFVNYCKEKFNNYQNFEIYNHSAIYFDSLLKDLSIYKVDYLVSSLPLSLISEKDLSILFNKIPKYLKNDGGFVQYQYSLAKYKLLKDVFKTVKLDFTITNLPPAFVYKCC